jgi:hypothetical protein
MATKAGVAALAVGAVYAAYDQGQKFLAENGGWDGVNAFLGLGTEGGDYGFTAVDAMMNRKAKEQAFEEGRIGTNVTGTPKAQLAVSDVLGGPGAAPRSYAEELGLPAPRPRPPGPYADGYAMPAVPAPQLTPKRDAGSAEQIQSNKQLQAALQQLMAKVGSTSGTLKIQLPKGATGELAGAPGVEVLQSGGF